MRLKAFSVFDEKAGAFMPPFFSTAVGQAVRSFGDGVRREDSPLSRHPEDYRLYLVGEFDDEKGQLVALDGPCQLVSSGVDHVEVKR